MARPGDDGASDGGPGPLAVWPGIAVTVAQRRGASAVARPGGAVMVTRRRDAAAVVRPGSAVTAARRRGATAQDPAF